MKLSYFKNMLLGLSVLWVNQACQKQSEPMLTNSPNGAIETEFLLLEGKPQFLVNKNGRAIVKPSTLGLALQGKSNDEFELLETITDENDTTWEPVWDKATKIRDNYKESTYWLNGTGTDSYKIGVVIRLYDDGVAIRYVLPEQEGLTEFTIKDDKTSFSFAKDYTYWATNGENHNLGPAPLSKYPKAISEPDSLGPSKDKEHLDYNASAKAIEIAKAGHTPTVIDLGEDGYAALLEAAIYDFADFNLEKILNELTLKCKMPKSKGIASAQTSWRVLLLGDDAGDLVESNTLVNLNPPCAIEDPSWIQPGKSVWDWRVWGYEGEGGFTYGLNTKSHKRFIDFAAENNIKYLLMDADWYGPEFAEDADPTSANDQINIEENMAYAKEKGISIILYLNDVGAKKFGLEKILKQFGDWGAAGVKYGFMSSEGQEKVQYTRKVVELCAKYKLTVNFHDGPVAPSGDRRTWPNLVTREYGHSQSDAKKSYYPETVVNQVFINMIAGPLDLCNLWFGFEGAESRDRVFEKIPGTVAAEAAKLAVLFSGIHVIPDAPEEYTKKANLFDFIKTLPDSFDELKVLDGQLDEFVSVGRRKGDNWYIGTLTNREARAVTMDFSFLEEGATYKATLYADEMDTHYMSNQETYTITERMIKRDEKITLALAPGGGHAMRLIKQ